MVESALYFALGFLVAALLILLALPAISRRAMRLANARARLQSPLSEAQARAESDALRGQHAVERVRLQRKVDAAEWDRAVARTELARQTQRMLQLDDLAKNRVRDFEALAVRYEALEEDAEALAAETGAREVALLDLTTQRDRVAEANAQALQRIAELESRGEHNRALIATLSAQATGLEVELADWRSKYGATPSASDNPVRDLYERLQRSEATREALTLEAGQRLKLLAERETALTKAEALVASLSARLAKLEAETKTTETDLRSRVLTHSTSYATAEGALKVERAARLEAQREIDALRARVAELEAASRAPMAGDAELRAEIARLGREFLSKAAEETRGNAAAIRSREFIGD